MLATLTTLQVLGLVMLGVAGMWVAAALVGFPVFSALGGLLTGEAEATAEALPPASVVVAVHNEADVVAARVNNLLAQDYPPDRLQIVIVSDGSTDDTVARARAVNDPRVVVLESVRVGKTAAVDKATAIATGDVLAFSDATTRWDPEALRRMVMAVQRPGVGAASGRIVYDYPDDAMSRGFGVYQRVERQLRLLGSRHAALTSVSGAMHVVRRSIWREIPADMTADVMVPALAALAGLGTVYVPDAIGHEDARTQVGAEFSSRVRISMQAWTSASWILPRLLAAGRLKALTALLLHKVLRWLVWVPSTLLLLGCGALAGWRPLFAVAAALQVMVYAVGGAWLRWGGGRKAPLPVAVASYWTLANASLARGFVRAMSGEVLVRWTPGT